MPSIPLTIPVRECTGSRLQAQLVRTVVKASENLKRPEVEASAAAQDTLIVDQFACSYLPLSNMAVTTQPASLMQSVL